MVDYSRKDVILIKDLGIIDGSRKGVYECVSEVDLEQIENIIEGGV